MARSHMTMDETTTAMNHANHFMNTTMNHANHVMTTTMFMDHGGMDHGGMDHGGMDHGGMDHGGMDHGGMDMGNGTMHGMMMYFHVGYEEYVLFKECYTESVGAMVGACFVIFFLAILYEGLKFIREMLLQRSLSSKKMVAYSMDVHAGSSKEHINPETSSISVVSRILSCSHFIQTGLHMVQVFISYCLMLVFMTYNVWLCLAVIVGAGVGYFLFGWKRAVIVDSNEHCH